MCFVSIYENARMKHVEIVLRGGGERTMDGVVNNKIYSKHIYKFCNVSPAQILYVN
jgi:hypothetical protein